ncbi:RagB/SusD family nutrient uptake outer membrane protein [Abyssalbus ytuae]|uniref:RagB/SusD family nutrient uptake outer membrane protein n=1 Tax=Abyssalbus ytuae TaxID=2926907 RepID=A0A9E7CTT3_9FLAO|nr:RagB/SusD family nutrient uptake outer membrane protein [Abyssalbus ytuae]UOB18641.1 RagB/SusD family nutrient uptake outer membrane protein [Abyssalbus ytuae]
MKRITKLNWFLMSFLALITATSCIDDLDVQPGDPDIILADDLFKDPDAYKQALAGVYGNLALTSAEGPDASNFTGIDEGTSQYGRGLWNLQEITTDEAIWSWETDAGVAELQRSSWTADNPLVSGLFGRAMFEVALANEFLNQTTEELLDSRGITGQVRTDMPAFRAEVRFLRSLAYFHMLDLFGKAPFVTEEDPGGSDYKGPEYNSQQLFDYIESELLAIIPDMKDPLQNEYGRADKGAAWMLLAKLYLNAEVYVGQARYSDCLTYCEQILNSGFTLSPEYLYNFMADNDSNAARNEIIFPVLSDGITTQNYGPPTMLVNGQVGNTERNGADFGVQAVGWTGAMRVTQRFSQIFLNGSYDTDDRNTLITENRPMEIFDIADRDSGYIIQKWSNMTSTGETGSANEIVDTDYPMFRLADVYLMYAEAHLRGGGGSVDTAVGYINELRTRANNPNLITATDLTEELLINERLVELHWEGHRRQDLVRFGRFSGGTYNWSWKGNAPSGLSIPAFRDLFPIPNASLAANPNLSQNEGY